MNVSKEPTLLVYIPSYNRFDILLKQIRIIEPQIDGVRCAIQIRDNCSTDPRYLELSSLVDPAKTRVARNSTNIGGNANFMLGYIDCGGYDFLWILGDDDFLRPDALSQILPRLSYDIDALYLQMKFIGVERTETYNMAALLENLNHGVGKISNIIYRTATVLPNAIDGYNYIRSGFPYVSALLASIIQKGKITVKSTADTIVFEDIPPSPPVEGMSGYALCLYGFPTLADFIVDSALRRKFLQGWILSMGDRVVRERVANQLLYRNCIGYLFGCSKWLWLQIFFLEQYDRYLRPLVRLMRRLMHQKPAQS